MMRGTQPSSIGTCAWVLKTDILSCTQPQHESQSLTCRMQRTTMVLAARTHCLVSSWLARSPSRVLCSCAKARRASQPSTYLCPLHGQLQPVDSSGRRQCGAKAAGSWHSCAMVGPRPAPPCDTGANTACTSWQQASSLAQDCQE